MKFFLFYILPILIYMTVIFYLSGLSSTGISLGFDESGFLLHIIEYFILCFLIHRGFSNSSLGFSTYSFLAFSISISVLYGITDEIHQSFIPNRTASLIDIFADFVGSVSGSVAYLKLIRKTRMGYE